MNNDDTSQRAREWLWLALVPVSLFVGLLFALISFDLPWSFQFEWVPSIGVELGWHVDALSAQFLVLILGIGTMVFVYASGYMAKDPGAGRLFMVLLLFMIAMIGVVSADNLILIFVCWELTSICSFFIVGYKYKDESVRASARQALFVTLGGGLALLAAFVLLAQIAGTWSLQEVIASAPLSGEDPRVPAALVLLFIGCFTKSAQFPFHFWLPNAMSAPTPASAYLHSATMVKLGIYLLARMDPAFNATLLWSGTLIGIGTITAVWASVLALRERDLKRILARSTISALGTLVVLIGLPFEQSALAVIAFLFAHSLYKAPLFFVAGNVDYATGTRNIDDLRGLRRNMPWTAVIAVIAALSMAGLPLSFGYVAKAVINSAKADSELVLFSSYGLLFVNAVAVAVAAVAAIRIFWGKANPQFSGVREVSWRMLLPPALIALIGLEFEFLPRVAGPLLLDAARAIAPGANIGELVSGGSFDISAIAAETTLIVGLLLFVGWDWVHRLLDRFARLDRYGPAAIFDRLLMGLSTVAAWHTRTLQHGRLDGYLRFTLTGLLILIGGAWFLTAPQWPASWSAILNWPEHAWPLIGASALIVAGAVAAPFLEDRLSLLMTIGVVGYGSAVLFLFSGAPDVAYTQFIVETVMVVVFSAALARYGEPATHPEPHARNAVLALASGLCVFFLLAYLYSLPSERSLAEWFAANSIDLANGRNVVNVILVDFRALDTFGEVTVVVFSALAAWPLLHGLRGLRASGGVR